MTLAANPRRDRYVASAGQTVFPYTFRVFAAADLRVEQLRGTSLTTLALSADYTVTGVGNDTGGTIVLTTGAQAGDIIAITSAQPDERTTDFSPSGDFRAAAINAELDRIWIAIQQMSQQLDRQITFPATDAAQSYLLPPQPARAGQLVGFGAGGELALLTGVSLGGFTVSSFSGGLLALSDAASWRVSIDAAGASTTVLRDGSQPMTGRLDLAPGTSGGLAFAGDTDTGLLQDGADTLRLRTGGATRLTVAAGGIEAHVPLAVPAATAPEHAVRLGQLPSVPEAMKLVQSVVIPSSIWFASVSLPNEDHVYMLIVEDITLSHAPTVVDTSAQLLFEVAFDTVPTWKTSGYMQANVVASLYSDYLPNAHSRRASAIILFNNILSTNTRKHIFASSAGSYVHNNI